MGVAIVLNGCDFSARNLGKVTFLQEAEVTSISITGDSSITGLNATYSASYLPANTNQRSCAWSIISGSEYASIDSATGILTIKATAATAQQVTIKATSTYNSAVTATKTVSVTYKETVDELTGISITGPDVAGLAGAQYSIIYNPSNTSKTGVTWSFISGGSYAGIDQNGTLTVIGSGNVTIQAVSIYDDAIVATKNVAATTSVPAIYLALNLVNTGILTDIVIPDLNVAEMEGLFMTKTTFGNTGFGSRTSGSSQDRFAFVTVGAGKFNAMYGGSATGDTSAGLSNGQAIKFVLNKDGVTVDDTHYDYSGTGNLSSNNTAPVALGNIYNNGTSSWHFTGNTCSPIRIAYLKIRENGVLTHDLNPYLDGVDFGMLDSITGRKYSAANIENASYVEKFYAG